MFYLKPNLPGVERVLRVILALCLAVAGYAFLSTGRFQMGAYAGAALLACTAVLGFCPACAMAGRKSTVRRS